MIHFRYASEALLIGILSLVFTLLPLDIASNFGGFLGRTIGMRLAASRKARRHIEAALPQADAQQTLIDMWDMLGRTIAEYPHLGRIAKARVRIEGRRHLDAAIAGDKGAVIISAHMANWEVQSQAVAAHTDVPVNITYRAPNNPYIDAMLQHFRGAKGRIAQHSKSRSGGQGAMKAVKNGELIGILIDQKYNQGLEAQFFGMPAMTNGFFTSLARKYDAPLIPCRLIRTGGAHFVLRFYPPINLAGREDLDVIHEAHSLLEAWITEHPGQWLWLHRRWKEL